MHGSQDHSARYTNSASGEARLRIHNVCSHPILRYYLQQMNLEEIVLDCLGGSRQGVIDHAKVLTILIHNLLLSPGPLYRLADWVESIEPSVLGLSPQQLQAINDDRAARALEALASSRGRNVLFRLALRVIKHFELDTRRVHFDTTPVTLYGEYAASVTEPRIARGHNPNHRTDLKQLKFGLNVVADAAVPISHGIYSGNRTDDTIHRGNWDGVRELLGRADFTYVADSKLCTRENLALIASHGGRFVTVLPRTRGEDKRFRSTLRREGVRWRKILELPGRRLSDPPTIYSTCAGPQRTDDGYRLIWVRSSAKARQDAERRQWHLEQAQRELVELSGKLNRRKLKTRAAIKAAVRKILVRHHCRHLLQVTVRSHKVITHKRLRRGRPGPSDPVREVIGHIYSLEVAPDEEALRRERRVDGVFPLITNLAKVSKKEILLIYKYQPYLEKRFALLKSELSVAPVYLKKPLRIAGLLQAYFIAMVLAALIERQVRRAMASAGIESLPLLPEGRSTRTPTTPRILEAFQEVRWYEFEGGNQQATFPIELTPLQEQLLWLLDVPRSLYS